MSSLEYERKQAKALIKQIRTGDAEALRRLHASHPAARDRAPDELQLADAQHVIAREQGFTSWPRMVEYFDELERHRNAPRYNSPDDDVERFQEQARGVLRRHQRGDPIVARELSHYVPRFYGRPEAEILATPITEDEARLVVARERRRASWEELLELAAGARIWRDTKNWEGSDSPMSRARTAIRNHDVAALDVICNEHPELLTPSITEREWRNTLASVAVAFERDATSPDARRVTDLLASRGVDIQRELNERLVGMPLDRDQPDTVRWLLQRGADPNWLPPNGITVLEHALVRYRSAACVDVIAAHVTPRRALWIAAGLGDVAGVRSFIAAAGRLTPEGRLNRPDLMAMGALYGLPPRHDADDLEIMWEAFQIAGWNSRWAAMDALLDAGLPIDHAPIGWPLIVEAVGNQLVPLAEYLVSRGADLDRDWGSRVGGSARALARSIVEYAHDPSIEPFRRILEICNAGTVEEILAKAESRRRSPPTPDERALRVMQLAADDAAHQGQTAVTTENMLVGFLRAYDGVFAGLFMRTGTDMPRLRAMIGERLRPDRDPLAGQELPAGADAEAAVRTAATEAEARHREVVSPHHLLFGIVSQETGASALLLATLGASIAGLREQLRSYI